MGNSPARGTTLTFAVVLLLAQACFAQHKIPDTEKALFDSVNRERTARGLPALKWDEGLARAARKHAEVMAEENVVQHQLLGEPNLVTRAQNEGTGFSHITENIGKAVYAGEFHDGWMQSPGHRANILDEGVDSVGIAVVEGGEQLFGVEDFARSSALLSLREQERQISRLVASHGVHPLGSDNDARRSCESGRDYLGLKKPLYVAHYETANVSELPKDLVKQLETGRYGTAAIAACSRKDAAGLAGYRIVVFLY
jgi:cysteine-rich secretory family protein